MSKHVTISPGEAADRLAIRELVEAYAHCADRRDPNGQMSLFKVLAKHTKSFNLVDTLSVGVDRIQRNFEPMQPHVESWRQTQISDAQAKLIFYSAFVDGELDAPKSLLPEVHRLYFEPQYADVSPRTMWSLSNAFTSAFKQLDPVPHFKATAKLREFLGQLPA